MLFCTLFSYANDCTSFEYPEAKESFKILILIHSQRNKAFLSLNTPLRFHMPDFEKQNRHNK